MPKSKSPQDLSVDELRWLLVEKRRAARQERLEKYRRTGRVVTVASDLETENLDSWRTGTLTEEETAPKPRSRGKRILDGFLLLIEISAVIGFIFILFNGLSVIQELNREVVAVLEQPTLTPTPLIMAVVLPSGHIPPDSPGGTRFNEAEIPDHLRPLVQSLYNVPVPTPGPEQAVRLQLPGINVDAPIVQGDGWEQLKKGVGQHLGSANPGEWGNLVLSAHNDIFGEIFRDLDRLVPGDLVIVFTNQRSYTYIVVDTKIVQPTAVEVMAPAAQPTVTLISCYPYLKDNMRIVVIARLQVSG
ncbi:MAG: class D sortase [Anaerolineales bacterium]|nr:class D sortase [Anaerolineales bacterium]